MKKHMILYAALAGAVLAGCSDGYGYRSGVAVSADYYDTGYYDGYYGPFYDGYWANDGYFYYSPGTGRPFVRDRHRHFRHNAHRGFNQFHGHGTAHPPVGHGGRGPAPPGHEHGRH
jgi:hypothetical protein